MNNKISVCLATFNEENNISALLESVRDLASEIIVVDGGSSDETVNKVKEFGARVVVTDNPAIFHINKQKAMDIATCHWILQMDADELITKKLSQEIMQVVAMTDSELEEYQKNLPSRLLFARHQKLIEERDGRVGDAIGPINAFFIPRRNYFLGKYLKYGGTYPDPAIRLVRKGKAYLPCKDVHEQMVVEGRVGWLQNHMLHKDSPTFERYLQRNNRYIELLASEFKTRGVGRNPVQFINYLFIQPIFWFLLTLIRHKGILDGYQGVVFSLFSALRFPRAYIRYLQR